MSKGAANLNAQIIRANGRVAMHLMRNMKDAVAFQRSFLKVKMNEPKSGQWYNHGFGPHRASAEFEYPATESGVTEASLKTSVRRQGRNMIVGSLSANSRAAFFLEFGSTRMTARPERRGFLRATLMDTSKIVGKTLAQR